MKRKVTLLLCLIAITLSTSSCSIIDTDGLTDVINAFSLWNLISFLTDNWLGVGSIAIATGLARSFKFLHLIKFKWLARGAAFGIVTGMFLSFMLFYAQFHEHFRDVYIIIIES